MDGLARLATKTEALADGLRGLATDLDACLLAPAVDTLRARPGERPRLAAADAAAAAFSIPAAVRR